jgi:integrase/recombinase XerC
VQRRTLGEEIEAFIDSRGFLSPNTVTSYRKVLFLFLREDCAVAEFLGRRSSTSCRTYHRHPRAFYNWTIAKGWRESNPCDEVLLPKVQPTEAHFFSRDEIDSVVCAIRTSGSKSEKEVLVPVIRFVCQTGLRLSEVSALRWTWIEDSKLNLQSRNGFRTKSGRDERVFLTPEALTVLREVQERPSNSNVFAAPSPEWLSKRFTVWRSRAGLPRGSFHSLRHTCTSWMAMNGASAYVIKRHLRHSSITVTERYMHLTPGNLSAQVTAALTS